MFFVRKKTSLAELPLEEVRFSSEDLFCLLGGNDACMVACGPGNLRLDRVERDRPDLGPWRRNLVNRYAAAGWVDAEGNPCPELARVIGALGQVGLAISYGRGVFDCKMGVVLGDEGAAGVVRAPGRDGGWYLRPFPEDRSMWPARFREVFPASEFPFGPAQREYHAMLVEPRGEDVVRGFRQGDEPYLRAYALRNGVDPDLLAAMGDAIREDPGRPAFAVFDYRGCEPDLSMGWRYFGEAVGHVRVRGVTLLPELGAVFSDCHAWRPGMPENWLSDIDRYRKESLFYSFDFYRSGDLLEALSHAPAHPEAVAAGEDPGLPKSWA